MGYAGGTKKAPTYHGLGDHSETIEVEYDPARISYRALLEVFWANHDPAAPSYSRQYRSAVFWMDEEQRKAAEGSKAALEARTGRKAATAIEKAGTFTPAEDYHQKYRLQNTPALMREFAALYPDFSRFVASTAAARVNGYLAGDGTMDQLRSELPKLGLSPSGRKALLDWFARAGR